MKVLLTGISGFVGHHAAEALHRHGHALRGLIRPTSDRSGFAHLPVEVALGDVLDRASLDLALAGVDAVVHVAGITRAVTAEQFFEVNAGGARNVIEAVRARGASKAERPRMVHVSSQAVMGPAPAGRASDEADLEAPLSQYGKSKLQAEQLVRAAADDIDAVMVRPPIVYGPRDKDVLAAFKLAKQARGLFIHPGFRDKRYSIIHGSDLGEGIALALEKGRGLGGGDRGQGVYFLTDGAVYTWSDLGRNMAASVGRKPRILPVPESLSAVVAVAQELQTLVTGKAPLLGFDKVRDMKGDNYVCSDARAKKELGFAAKYDVPAGFKQTADWYQAHGWI
ncbi:MAG: NAD-dependent epimerase/dehydratase family protein [Myxococcales bacterium]